MPGKNIYFSEKDWKKILCTRHHVVRHHVVRHHVVHGYQTTPQRPCTTDVGGQRGSKGHPQFRGRDRAGVGHVVQPALAFQLRQRTPVRAIKHQLQPLVRHRPFVRQQRARH